MAPIQRDDLVYEFTTVFDIGPDHVAVTSKDRTGLFDAFMQKLKVALIQTQIKEGTRAGIERGKLDLSAMSTAIDGRLQLREFLDTQDQQDAAPDQSAAPTEETAS